MTGTLFAIAVYAVAVVLICSAIADIWRDGNRVSRETSPGDDKKIGDEVGSANRM